MTIPTPTVFISYSHKDEIWKDRLVTHLGVLHHQGLLRLWDDRSMTAGGDWYKQTQEAMKTANIAILLVSPNFLTSEFMLREEVHSLLRQREERGMRILPLIVNPLVGSPWDKGERLAHLIKS